ncbi:hypothetical protein AB1Y20_003690 [Prymnesium parvum]|uniref:Uncharacterized protein n=1 Tax=Prymnesium parvum TaxID=97485 RepID=A0AB34J7A1_PRYPA
MRLTGTSVHSGFVPPCYRAVSAVVEVRGLRRGAEEASRREMRGRTTLPLLCAALALTWHPVDAREARLAAGAEKGGAVRAERERGSIFDVPEGDEAVEEADAEWAAEASAIAAEMRAHIARAKKRMQADLIGSDRNLIVQGVVGVVNFFRSKYFRNVRRSLLTFACAWLWYVLNTKTYTPPEYDD